MLLNESNEMEITGHKIGTVRDVAHNLPAQVQYQLEVWLSVWGPIFFISFNPFRSIQLTNEINIKSLPPLYRRFTPFSSRQGYKPQWGKYLNTRGDYKWVCCISSGIHVPSTHRSQKEVLGIKVPSYFFFLISCIYQSTWHNTQNR